MIKIDLITGFLGAGKTTFIRKYAKYLIDSGKNIGILENDFGAVNVDMMMLQDLMGDQCELEMISGGCDPETHRRRFKTKLAVRPCQEDEKDSFRWCSATSKRSPRQITCRIFFAKVVSLMGWNSAYRYKLLGKLIKSDNELLFVFDLTTPEIFVRSEKEDGKIKTSRTPSYPEEWQNQFGVPVEEHQSSLQINMFDGYAVFGISENSSTSTPEENPEHPEKEEQHYEQTNLFEAGPLH